MGKLDVFKPSKTRKAMGVSRVGKKRGYRRGRKLLYVGGEGELNEKLRAPGRFMPKKNYRVRRLPKSAPEKRRGVATHGLYRIK